MAEKRGVRCPPFKEEELDEFDRQVFHQQARGMEPAAQMPLAAQLAPCREGCESQPDQLSLESLDLRFQRATGMIPAQRANKLHVFFSLSPELMGNRSNMRR